MADLQLTQKEKKAYLLWEDGEIEDDDPRLTENVRKLIQGIKGEGDSLNLQQDESYEEPLEQGQQETEVQNTLEEVEQKQEGTEKDALAGKDTSKEKPKTLGEKYYEKSNEANTYKQKYKSLESKFEEMLKDPRKLKEYAESKGLKVDYDKIDLDRVYEEDNLRKLAEERNNRQESEALKNAVKSDFESRNKPIQTAYELQEQFEHLSTERDVSEISEAILKIQRKNLQPSEELLVKEGFSKTDIQKYSRLNEIIMTSRNSGVDPIAFAIKNGEHKKAIDSRVEQELKRRMADQKRNDIANIPKPVGNIQSQNHGVENQDGSYSQATINKVLAKEATYGFQELTDNERRVWEYAINIME